MGLNETEDESSDTENRAPAVTCSQSVLEQIKNAAFGLMSLASFRNTFKSIQHLSQTLNLFLALPGEAGEGQETVTIACCQHQGISMYMVNLHSAALLLKWSVTVPQEAPAQERDLHNISIVPTWQWHV